MNDADFEQLHDQHTALDPVGAHLVSDVDVAVTAATLRVRLTSGRHPYGSRVWTWEIYDTARPIGMQDITSGCWFSSWDSARARGLNELEFEAFRREQRMTAAGGDCVMTRLGSEPPYELRIDRADPVIYIHAEVLKELRGGNSPYASLVDDVLRIEGVNRTVIYRLGEYDPQRNAYLAARTD